MSDKQQQRQSQLSGLKAEGRGYWHVAIKHYLDCFEQAQTRKDEGARRFYAAKLSSLYRMMGMSEKAAYYALFEEH